MIVFRETTDASLIYRDTSALSTLRTDNTSDTGNLLQVIRDSVLVLGSPAKISSEEKIPEQPSGSIEAVYR